MALYQKVNEGTVRVLIGSTFKLGIGANVQIKLKAIHHLDVPWRPADMVQREGRILRKGNQYQEVYIYRYICEGSFDAYSWQILESKQKFISQFLMGSAYQRTASDLEENILSYAEVKALALSDPRMKVLAEKENDLANLRILNNKHVESKRQMKDEIAATEKDIESLEIKIQGTEANCADLTSKTEKDYKVLRQILSGLLMPEQVKSGNRKIGVIWGYEIEVPTEQNLTKPYMTVSKNGAAYRIESGESASGNAQRVVNLLIGLDKRLLEYKNTLEEKQRHLEQLKKEMGAENTYIDRIKALEKEVKQLRVQIGDA